MLEGRKCGKSEIFIFNKSLKYLRKGVKSYFSINQIKYDMLYFWFSCHSFFKNSTCNISYNPNTFLFLLE